MISRNRLQGRLGALDVREAIREIQREDSLLSFVDYLYDPDPRVCRHAAWVLTKVDKEQLLQLQTQRQRLTDLVLQTPDRSLCRMVLNLLERMPIDEESLRTDLLDFCLAHMLSPDEPSGVQALCMKIAHHITRLYPELKEEFRLTLEAMDECYYTPGVTSLRRKLLRR